MNSNTSVMDCTFFDKASEMLTLNEIASHIITVEEIMNILEKAIHLFNVAKRMNSKSTPSTFRYQFIPFMSCVSSLFFSAFSTNPSLTRLDNLIASWKMKRQEVSKDGNCCFTSVSIGLQTMGSSMKTLHPELNFDSNEIMSQQLRQVAVKSGKRTLNTTGFMLGMVMFVMRQISSNSWDILVQIWEIPS